MTFGRDRAKLVFLAGQHNALAYLLKLFRYNLQFIYVFKIKSPSQCINIYDTKLRSHSNSHPANIIVIF